MSGFSTHTIFSITARQSVPIILLPLAGMLLPATGVSAQVVAADDATGTVIDAVGDRIDITGGQLSSDRTNLFQSFEQFDLQTQQTANFVTDPNIQNVVGRISSDNASTINGTLQVSGSDASLYLMNPAGILTGPDAQLNLSGGFTATTATDIGFGSNGEPDTFYFENEQAGAVVNLGDLSVEEGQAINLVGGTVVNTGTLSAPEGSITVAAVEGESLVRLSQGDQLLSLEVESLDSTQQSYRSITPTSLSKMLTGSELTHASALITDADGIVRLTTQPENAISEVGGSALVSGTLLATGETGGNINILGEQVELSAATINASGNSGGGLIRVGGDYQGGGAIATATNTTIDSSSTLLANAHHHGNGGTIINWADQNTVFSGSIEAKGGLFGGDGGFTEISGKTNLDFAGRANVSAPQGQSGNILLDPENLIIATVQNLGIFNNPLPSDTGVTEYRSIASLEGLIGDVTIEARHNIVIDSIDDHELRFADGTNVTFTADSDKNGLGAFFMDSADTLRSEQGNITITGAGITVGNIDTSTDAENSSGSVAGGDVTLISSQQVTAESITTKGERDNNAADGGNVLITADLGNITINGDIDTRSQANTSASGRAGDIEITANNGTLTTDNIFAYSEAPQNNAGSAGNVTIDALAVTTNGNIRANASTYGNNAGRGGDVTITANTVNVTGGINTISQGTRETRNGGKIEITAEEEISVTGDIIAFSAAYGGSNSGNGGNVLLTSNQISTGSIGTQTSASTWSSIYDGGKAGSVVLQAYSDTADSSIDIDYIYATSYARNGHARDGGKVTITSDSVAVNGIQTFSQAIGDAAGNSGNVSLYADTDLRVGFGGILSRSRSTTGITGNSGRVTLVADDINLVGQNRITGESVLFRPSDLSQNIQIGTPTPISNETLLSIGERELKAIGNVEQIQIGDADSTGIVTLLAHTVSLPAVIEVQGGEQLVGTASNNIFELESATAGTITGRRTVRFSNIEKLNGGPGGTNSVRVQAPISSPFEINLENLTNIQSVVGNSNEAVVLRGSNSSNLWQITGPNQGSVDNGNAVVFRRFGHLIGGTDNDQFYLQESGSLTGRIDGKSGNNRLSTPSAGNIWEVTGRNQGQLLQSDNSLLIFDNIGYLENTAAENTAADSENSAAHQVSFLGDNAQITGAITAGQNDLTLVGDHIAIGELHDGDFSGGLISGTGRLFIRPQSEGINIELGGSQTEDSSSTLSITQGEVEAIQVGFLDISIGGEQTDRITLNDSVSFLNDVVLQAQGDINGRRLANSRRAGVSTLGAIAITSETGKIQVGALQTNNADVSLTSPGSIEIEFIDTANSIEESQENPLTETQIVIDTQADFRATGTNESGESIVSNSRNTDAISILYGNSSRAASPFIVGSATSNGTAGSIKTGSSKITPFNAFTDASHTTGNIRLTNRNIRQQNEVEITDNITEELIINLDEVAATTSSTEASGGLPTVYHSNTTAEMTSLSQLFTQLEVGVGAGFNRYLGITASSDSPPATFAEIQNTLATVQTETDVTPAVVYVYFVPDAGSEDAVVASNEHVPQPEDQLEVMVVTQDDMPVRRRRWGITRAQIEEASRSLRQQVTSEFSTARQYLPPAQQLYDWIVRPLETTLQERGVDSLGFVMDTGLRTLPIATLHTGDRYLIEDYSLGILPTFSLTDFGNTLETAPGHRTDFSTAQVLAMGASTFKDQPDLPAVNAEVKLIAEELWDGDAFLNEDFVLSNLQTQLQDKDYGVVHLATHAVFESGNLDDSYIQLWDEQLSLAEMSELHLSEADIGLIILSACSTALGDEASEYGFAGFAVNAGSPSALASIWPVNDEGTLGFMSQFYEQLRTAPARAEALRQTQLSLITGSVGIKNGTVYGPDDNSIAELPELANSGQWDFSHPFYWSAFTMIGNPW